jgi:hypothetical protein
VTSIAAIEPDKTGRSTELETPHAAPFRSTLADAGDRARSCPALRTLTSAASVRRNTARLIV